MANAYAIGTMLLTPATTATGVHWGSVRAKQSTSGTHCTWSVKFGFAKTGPYSFVEIGDLGDDYERTCGTVNLADTGYRLAIQLTCTHDGADHTTDPTATVDVIFPCAGLGARIPDEVPSQTAAGTGKTRTQGSILTAYDLDNDEGTMDIVHVPRFHGTSAPTSAETIVELGVTEIVGLDGSGDVEVADGSNEANADLTEADGTSRTIRAAWEAGDVDDLYAAVLGGDDGTATYDGSFPTGDVEIKGTCRATRAVRIYDVAKFDTDEMEP